MSDLIDRQAAIDAICTEGTRLERNGTVAMAEIKQWCVDILEALPAAQPTLRERALMLLLSWAIECDFGYDNIPEEYARYEDEIKEMGYTDGMIYIAEKEVERNDKTRSSKDD